MIALEVDEISPEKRSTKLKPDVGLGLGLGWTGTETGTMLGGDGDFSEPAARVASCVRLYSWMEVRLRGAGGGGTEVEKLISESNDDGIETGLEATEEEGTEMEPLIRPLVIGGGIDVGGGVG